MSCVILIEDDMETAFEKIQAGLTFEMEKIVQPEDSASRYDSGLVEVFATPAMIALMEGTCYRCVMSFLPEGFSTVGAEVNIRHLKATPIGMKVKCVAVLAGVEGKRLDFDVKAWDEHGQIGEGKHVRFIIDEKRFIEKLTGKQSE
jgi:fluoroacetyl-CoA thioesterase